MTYPKWYDMTVSMENMRQTVAETGFIKKLSISEDDLRNHLEKVLDEICERYAYGDETGQDGYRHFQIRFVLKKDTWKPQNLALHFMDHGIRGHLTPSHVRNFEYVEKEGRYVRSWEKSLKPFVNITPNLWQIFALELWKNQSDRTILVILDKKGGHGKTFLRKHMIACHMAQFIPPLERAEDIMAIAMAKPSKGYVIDLPKAESKARKSMWSAIEQIKDGYLYDKRYNWKEKWIDPPKIMVFCNTYNENDLSSDRWTPYDITDFKQEV